MNRENHGVVDAGVEWVDFVKERIENACEGDGGREARADQQEDETDGASEEENRALVVSFDLGRFSTPLMEDRPSLTWSEELARLE